MAKVDSRDQTVRSVSIPKKAIQEICNSELAQRLLTLEEVRRPRRCEELIRWVDQLSEQIRESKEAKDIARLCGRPYKEFREGILPFSVFAKQELEPNLSIELPIDDGNCDVIVKELVEDDSEQRIEIVNAGWDYEERLRMEMLTFRGDAPAAGPIAKKNDVGPNQVIEARMEAERHDTKIEAVKSDVLTALKRKEKNDYPEDTWLIIAFDDALLFKADDYAQIADVAKRAAENSQFSRVYVVGLIKEGYCRRVR